MFAELFRNNIVLATCKKNPKITKKEMAFILSKNAENDQPEEPFSEQEINAIKEFQKKHAPSSYSKIFPEEKIQNLSQVDDRRMVIKK